MYERLKWERIVKNFSIVEDFPEKHESVISYKAPLPPFMTSRDYCIGKKVFFDFPKQGQVCVFQKSREYQKVPPIPKTIRANLILNATIFEDDGNGGTKLRGMMQNDFKGDIPIKIINYAATKMVGKWLNAFEAGVLDYMKRNNIEKLREN